MFVVSYCQIYSFHPRLNLEKIVIFQSFQQSADKLYNLNQFRHEHTAYFDKITCYQLKDAADAVLAREKSTSVAALFSVELKFTIDTLNALFSDTIKSNFQICKFYICRVLITYNNISCFPNTSS